ncbi:MAG: hypothetical protein EHJ95_03610 [Methanobacteriota archaeon]|nr:MAG: hypothetical protein EHJ95_03610 [Euryarchaeota archaeon]
MAEEQLYDMIVPPGVPRSVIRDVIKKFDVQMVERARPLKYANMDGDERSLIAFRGKREVVEEVEAYVFEQLKRFIDDEQERAPEPEKPAT